jgi:Flp pilus assembly protein TadD
MRTPKNALLIASSIVLALPVTGCAMGGQRPSGFASKVDKGNIGVALKAQAALEQGDTASAVRFAEQAVENSPGDAGFRSLLGNVYFAAGRFRSAEAAYGDALTLIPGQPGVPLRLALAQAALGKSDSAIATLETWQGQIDPADAGLALALAGRPGAAVELLDRAARQPGADPRVRQNLALAHALAGDWDRARSIAAQDVPADQLEARMSEWAVLARPGQPGAQVAALIGVPAAASDQGQPERLALRSAPENVRLAAQGEAPDAQAVVEGAAVAPAPVAVAAAEPAPEPVAPVAPQPIAVSEPVSVPEAVAAQMPEAAPAPVVAPDVAEMLDSIRREPVRTSGALPLVSELRRSAARRFEQSRAVVQLGAYATEEGVRMGWTVVSRRHSSLRAYVPASARFNGPDGTVYRLSLKGFASDSEARQLCMSIKAKGGSCFVRNAAGDAPVRFAKR